MNDIIVKAAVLDQMFALLDEIDSHWTATLDSISAKDEDISLRKLGNIRDGIRKCTDKLTNLLTRSQELTKANYSDKERS